LGHPDDNRVDIADVLFGFLGLICKEEENAGHNKHDANQGNLLRKKRLDLVVEKQTNRCRRDHGKNDLDRKDRFIVPLELKQSTKDLHYIFPKYDDRAQSRCKVEYHGHHKAFLWQAVIAQDRFTDLKVATAAHREELCQSLNDTEDDRL